MGKPPIVFVGGYKGALRLDGDTEVLVYIVAAPTLTLTGGVSVHIIHHVVGSVPQVVNL
jgi:hypothetical protein